MLICKMICSNEVEDMKILVVGANGLLGRYLVQALSLNHTVYAIVKDVKNINFILNDQINIIEVDLTKLDENLLPKEIDAIYYVAQSNQFREFPNGAQDMLDINVDAPLQLAKFGVQIGVKYFIYASSGGVYTDNGMSLKESSCIDATKKLGFYLNSKLSAEMLLKNYASLFKTFAIIRPFFMYGFGQNRTMLLPRLIDNVMQHKEIVLNGETGICINPIYVTDAVNAILKILDLEGEYTINIAGNEVVSLRQICSMIGEITLKTPSFKCDQSQPNNLIADISLMESLLQKPKISLYDGISMLAKSL